MILGFPPIYAEKFKRNFNVNFLHSAVYTVQYSDDTSSVKLQ